MDGGETPTADIVAEPDSVALVAYSGELDKLLAVMMLATSAASSGSDVHLFFTFWGTAALRKHGGSTSPRPLIERLFGWLLPRGTRGLPLSRLHMGGLGAAMVKRRIKSKRFADLDELFEMARMQGVNIHVCDMSMDLLGIRESDLIDYPNLNRCGATTFLEFAMNSKVSLFI